MVLAWSLIIQSLFFISSSFSFSFACAAIPTSAASFKVLSSSSVTLYFPKNDFSPMSFVDSMATRTSPTFSAYSEEISSFFSTSLYRSVSFLVLYSRSDKKDQSRVPVTAKLMANLLEAAGVDHVLTCDLHNQAIQAYFNINCDVLTHGKLINTNQLYQTNVRTSIYISILFLQ